MDLDVLLPFHRVDDYFIQAIESLAKTQGVSFNTILIDDRKDRSVNVFQLLLPIKNKVVVETAGGIGYGAALEIGTKYLKNDVVALFNSDDLISPFRFKKQIANLDSSDLNITKMQRINGANQKINSLSGQIKSETYDPIFLLLGAYGANASWCMRRDWWEKNSFFDSDEMLDWRIALNCFERSNISYLPENLYFYRKHSSQVTAKRQFSTSSLVPLYESWTKFGAIFDITAAPFEVFVTLALPWVVDVDLDFKQANITAKQISNAACNLSEGVYRDVNALIQRRYLSSLRRHSSYGDKVKCAFSGAPQAINSFWDLLIEVIR